MKVITATLFLCILTFSFYAGDIITKSGKEYKKISILAIKKSGIQIIHSTGVVTLKIDEIPDNFIDSLNERDKARYQKYKDKEAKKKEELEKQRKLLEEKKKKEELEKQRKLKNDIKKQLKKPEKLQHDVNIAPKSLISYVLEKGYYVASDVYVTRSKSYNNAYFIGCIISFGDNYYKCIWITNNIDTNASCMMFSMNNNAYHASGLGDGRTNRNPISQSDDGYSRIMDALNQCLSE